MPPPTGENKNLVCRLYGVLSAKREAPVDSILNLKETYG